MYMQKAQEKKVKKFEAAINSFQRYRAWNKRLLAEGKITKEQFDERLAKRAEMLDL